MFVSKMLNAETQLRDNAHFDQYMRHGKLLATRTHSGTAFNLCLARAARDLGGLRLKVYSMAT